MWWTSLASANASNMVYKPPPVQASIVNGNQLVLKLGSSPWHEQRKAMQLDKIIPDHGHLMHLFLIRMPGMDRFYHLHPEQTASGEFEKELPALDEGHYALFADIVRESGFPDTMTAQLDIPQTLTNDNATALMGDDSEVGAGQLPSTHTYGQAPLSGDEQMEWLISRHGFQAQKPTILLFRVVDKKGNPATDLEPYMGMAGHLVIVRRDLSVFAHVHPAGSVPMAALMLLEKEQTASTHRMDTMHYSERTPTDITFPYGFPQAGDYRLFLQVKRAGRVETAVFDTHVEP
jgi:hypothetical protein